MNYRDLVRSQRKSRYDRNDETTKFENSKGWRKISHAVRHRNPICQAIEHGEQCHRAATQVHHLEAPEFRPDLRIFWGNLVALCDRHHVPGKGDCGLFRYVPTIGFNGEVYSHSGIMPLAPTAKRRDIVPPTGTPGAPLFVSRTVSATKVDEAIGTQAEIDELLAGL
jgi:hypothetical protein